MKTYIEKGRAITRIYLSGKLSSTIIIPINMARKYGMDKPCYVSVEERPEGILVRKARIE